MRQSPGSPTSRIRRSTSFRCNGGRGGVSVLTHPRSVRFVFWREPCLVLLGKARACPWRCSLDSNQWTAGGGRWPWHREGSRTARAPPPHHWLPAAGVRVQVAFLADARTTRLPFSQGPSGCHGRSPFRSYAATPQATVDGPESFFPSRFRSSEPCTAPTDLLWREHRLSPRITESPERLSDAGRKLHLWMTGSTS